MYYKNMSDSQRKKANLRQEISMYLNRIKMIEKTLELFESSNTDPELEELEEFWKETLYHLKYDLHCVMTEHINIPEQD